jgi:hypothetical protein
MIFPETRGDIKMEGLFKKGSRVYNGALFPEAGLFLDLLNFDMKSFKMNCPWFLKPYAMATVHFLQHILS